MHWVILVPVMCLWVAHCLHSFTLFWMSGELALAWVTLVKSAALGVMVLLVW